MKTIFTISVLCSCVVGCDFSTKRPLYEYGGGEESSSVDVDVYDTDTQDQSPIWDWQDLVPEKKPDKEEPLDWGEEPDVADTETAPDSDADTEGDESSDESSDEDGDVMYPCLGIDCDDNDPCTKDSCDPDTGKCIYDAIAGCCNFDDECDDGNICNGIETCLSNKCSSAQVLKCSDDNVCTDDSCAPSEGCIHTQNNEPCDDDNVCTDNDTCADGKCVGKLWCVCIIDADCPDDVNLCNGTYKCQGNFCVIDLETVVDCADDDPCTKDSCDPATGKCAYDAVADCCNSDKECDNSDKCDGAETCVEHECVAGQELKCDDGKKCTMDSCDPIVGCVNASIQGCCIKAQDCDDDDVCTSEVCFDNTCGWTIIQNCCLYSADCDDSNVCTDDKCVNNQCEKTQINGCCNLNAECSDNNLCNGKETCVNSECQQGIPLVCDDVNVCTDDSCDPTNGCVYTPNLAPCDDGDKCTTSDFCSNKVCQSGTPVLCDDLNPCTDDSCINGECAFTPNTAPCDDSNPCTINDACQDKLCIGEAVPCECQSIADCAKLEDGNLCNGTLKCQNMVCVVDKTTIVECPPTKPCMDNTCSPDTGECKAEFVNGNTCDDGDLCTTGDVCTGGLWCVGVPITCDDKNVCTSDSCESSNGKCVYAPLKDCCNSDKECDNSDKCDGAETCKDNKCQQGIPLVCDDNNDCTADGCVPAIGCIPFNLPNNTPCNDKDACTVGDTCQTGKCKAGQAIVCDDNNVCTKDSCDVLAGCEYTPSNEGVACGDANVCNGVETCANGLCAPGIPLLCNDNNVCTDDSCDPLIGCVHASNTKPCNDGNACTTNDTCENGKCQPGAGKSCDDDKPCSTWEECDKKVGCFSIYLGDFSSLDKTYLCDTDKDGKQDGGGDMDSDNDGVCDPGDQQNLEIYPGQYCSGQDNCPLTANADQKDTDNDGLGDACDPDKNGDGIKD